MLNILYYVILHEDRLFYIVYRKEINVGVLLKVGRTVQCYLKLLWMTWLIEISLRMTMSFSHNLTG